MTVFEYDTFEEYRAARLASGLHVIGRALFDGLRADRAQEAADETARLIADLTEVRAEITRLNTAAGETVFNPAATAALDGVLRTLQAKE